MIDAPTRIVHRAPSTDAHRVHVAVPSARERLLAQAGALFAELDREGVTGTDVARVVLLDQIRRLP